MRYRCWLEWLLSLADNIFGTSATVRISHLSITNTSSFSMYGKVDSPLRIVTWKNHNSDHHCKNELNLVGPCAAKVIEIVQRKVQLFQSCPSLKVLNSLLWPQDLCFLMETCARVAVGTVVNKFLPRPVKCWGLFKNDVITFGGYRDPPPPPCHYVIFWLPPPFL